MDSWGKIIIGLCAAVAAPTAFADSGWYVGAKGGLMIHEGSAFDSAFNGGIVVGLQGPVKNGTIGLEGEFTASLMDGDINRNNNNASWDVDTIGLFGVFRSQGAPYIKAKLGVVDADDTHRVGFFSQTYSDSNIAFGIGIGSPQRLGNVELEFTVINEDINFLSLGLNFDGPQKQVPARRKR